MFWMLKSISVSQPISRVFWLAFDLQQCKMIYVRFYWLHLEAYISFQEVYVSIFLDKCLNTVP